MKVSKSNRFLNPVMALLMVACIALSAHAEKAPYCAVLGFEPGGDITVGDCGLMADRLSTLLGQREAFAVLPRYQALRTLTESGLHHMSVAKAFDAGKVLDVDYVITGKASGADGGSVLRVDLLDVGKQETKKSVEVKGEKSVKEFVRRAPAVAIDLLLGQEPAVAAKPTPAPKTASVLEPVESAKPAPRVSSPPPASPARPSSGRSEWFDGLGDRFGESWNSDDNWLVKVVRDRLEIGLRLMETSWDTTERRGNTDEERFIGSIDELQEEDTSSVRFFLRYYPIPWLGLEWTQDELSAKTFTDTPDNHSDGSFTADGSVVTVLARATVQELLRVGDWAIHGGEMPPSDRYAWGARIRPYFGIGRAMLSTDFEADPWWALGYPSEQDWIADGSPVTRPAGRGRRRSIDTDNSDGDVVVAGCTVELMDYVFAEFMWRSMELQADATYTLDSPPRFQESTIPFDNTAYGFGVGIAF